MKEIFDMLEDYLQKMVGVWELIQFKHSGTSISLFFLAIGKKWLSEQITKHEESNSEFAYYLKSLRDTDYWAEEDVKLVGRMATIYGNHILGLLEVLKILNGVDSDKPGLAKLGYYDIRHLLEAEKVKEYIVERGWHETPPYID